MKLLALAFLLPFSAFAAPEAPTLTDAQITKVLVTINEGELKAAHLANHRASSQGAKNFAKMMMDAHEKNLAATKSLAKKEKIGMDKSELAASIADDAKTANTAVSKADHRKFDQAYLNEQISMHEKALETLNGTLIPNAKSEVLRSHLEATSKDVASHLAMAKSSSAGKDNAGN